MIGRPIRVLLLLLLVVVYLVGSVVQAIRVYTACAGGAAIPFGLDLRRDKEQISQAPAFVVEGRAGAVDGGIVGGMACLVKG